MNRNELVVFRPFGEDEIFSCIAWLADNLESIDSESKDEMIDWYCYCVSEMANVAENIGVKGNIWHTWLAVLFAERETAYAVAHEKRKTIAGTLANIAKQDLSAIYKYVGFDLGKIDKVLGVGIFGRLKNFVPSSLSSDESAQRIQELADGISAAKNSDELCSAIESFYEKYGVGMFALNSAFRWDSSSHSMVGLSRDNEVRLSDLVGYESQKRRLVDNTLAFLEGRPANNVLLYGESGTGKSTSIKALLNEFTDRGLRMIEVYKHQIADLTMIIDLVKNRNYKFILFMDDLSFEEFEIEYKYLKAFIEGGLEKNPDNVLIYATSNRRHLMKETWSDRLDKSDDMHESETMQEKMSLVDRFGIMIRYLSPRQEEYLKIVGKLAEEEGIVMDPEELRNGAIRWELQHGGFSGRCARQYVDYLAGRKS